MVQVIWTPRFSSDLQELKLHLDKDFPGAFSKLGLRIERKLTLLHAFPELGRIVPDQRNPRIREIIVGRYRIIYEIVSVQEIWVHLIHNSSREKLSLE